VESTETSEGNGTTGEPSVSSSIEHLVAGSQGVITKRIDLALLEGQDLLSRVLERAALVSAGIVFAAAAWFAGAAALVLFVMPDATRVVHLTAYALVNGACAVGVVALAPRRARPQTRVRLNANGSKVTAQPLPPVGKD
jgi:uncharacterized membrane protein YqjE